MCPEQGGNPCPRADETRVNRPRDRRIGFPAPNKHASLDMHSHRTHAFAASPSSCRARLAWLRACARRLACLLFANAACTPRAFELAVANIVCDIRIFRVEYSWILSNYILYLQYLSSDWKTEPEWTGRNYWYSRLRILAAIRLICSKGTVGF